jgi:type VI secretion system protein VasD
VTPEHARAKPGSAAPAHPRQALRSLLAGGLVLTLLAGLSACGAVSNPFKAAVTSLAGNVQASADLNPSVSQRPSPLRVRVYELKSATAFNQADFMALYQGDQAALGADLVSREELMLQPGETRALNKNLAADTRFLGVVAVYRDLERATWRTTVAIKPGAKNSFDIRAERLAVTVKPRP